MQAIGLDLSLRATGIARVDGTAMVVHTGHLRGMPRLDVVRMHVVRALAAQPDLVAVERYAYGARGSAVVSLGELGGVIRHAIWSAGLPYVEVAPSQLKLYATGKAQAGKTAMVIAARDLLGYEGDDADAADSLWLRAMALDFLGDPLVEVSATRRGPVDRLEPIGGKGLSLL